MARAVQNLQKAEEGRALARGSIVLSALTVRSPLALQFFVVVGRCVYKDYGVRVGKLT